jgi:hypothetical protein
VYPRLFFSGSSTQQIAKLEILFASTSLDQGSPYCGGRNSLRTTPPAYNQDIVIIHHLLMLSSMRIDQCPTTLASYPICIYRMTVKDTFSTLLSITHSWYHSLNHAQCVSHPTLLELVPIFITNYFYSLGTRPGPANQQISNVPTTYHHPNTPDEMWHLKLRINTCHQKGLTHSSCAVFDL